MTVNIQTIPPGAGVGAGVSLGRVGANAVPAATDGGSRGGNARNRAMTDPAPATTTAVTTQGMTLGLAAGRIFVRRSLLVRLLMVARRSLLCLGGVQVGGSGVLSGYLRGIVRHPRRQPQC